MENTQKVLFEDDSPQWYIAMGTRWIGPVAASDVYERVQSGKITWAHFVWKPGEKEWKRLCDIPMFAAAVPQRPSKSLQSEVKEVSISREISREPGQSKKVTKTAESVSEPVVKSATQKNWYLYFNETQFGPFMHEEIVRFLQVGKITPRVHAWKGGLSNWTRIENLDPFKEALAELKPLPATSGAAEKTGATEHRRKDPRRPMVAKILLANAREVSDAICRDISVGGMQVLTDQIPGQVGERIRLNVSAASGGDSFESFVAEGVIVRLLEDQKGFSFRFEKLSDQAKRAIEQYISS